MSKEVMNDVTDLQVVDVPTLDGAPLSSKRSLLSPPTYTPLPKTDDERSSYSSDGGGIAFNTNFLKFDAGVLYSVHRKKPIIFLYGMALLVLFASFGCAVVYFLTEIHIDSHKMAISIGPAADLENGIRADFESLSSGTKHLASYVRLSPNCSDIDRDYELHLQEIMRWDDRLTSLEILPSYVLKYRYPLTAIEENVDYLGVSNLDAQYDINTGELWFTVPALYNNSIVGLYACYAIWLPADSYDKDFGNFVIICYYRSDMFSRNVRLQNPTNQLYHLLQ